jgi:serine/threonine-protein kinase PRP4
MSEFVQNKCMLEHQEISTRPGYYKPYHFTRKFNRTICYEVTTDKQFEDSTGFTEKGQLNLEQRLYAKTKIVNPLEQVKIDGRSLLLASTKRQEYQSFLSDKEEKIGKKYSYPCQDSSTSTVETDIFATTSPEVKEWELTHKRPGVAGKHKMSNGLQDTWDDSDGYYNFTMGEIILGRFEIFAFYGRGVFSSVMGARDLYRNQFNGSKKEVAIKMIRANETMFKIAQQERIILNRLSLTDPENKRHIIKLMSHFIYRDHVCLVFEQMDLNLRACIKKFGRDVGFNIHAVRAYSIQLLIALKHLKNNGILHADIKPDNILVNDTRTVVKLCDFGSAMFPKNTNKTPYLVSRFYRAPEIILGLPYDTSIDIWSMGCVIFELFTGRVMYPGKSNGDMLKLIINAKGLIPKKMLRNGIFVQRYFDIKRSVMFLPPLSEDSSEKIGFLTSRLTRIIFNQRKLSCLFNFKEEAKKVAQVADLLDKMFMVEPDKRLTPIQALKHPFCEVEQIN